MTEYLTELLDAINADTSKLNEYKYISSIDAILKYSFDPALKMKLPLGYIPFSPSAEPIGFCPSSLLDEYKRFYIFLNETISEERRNVLFIQMLEKIHPSEAKILTNIKDQNLSMLYPNITANVLVTHDMLPESFLTEEPSEQPVELIGSSVETDIVEDPASFFADVPMTYIEPVRDIHKPTGGIAENLSADDIFSIVLNPPPKIEESPTIKKTRKKKSTS